MEYFMTFLAPVIIMIWVIGFVLVKAVTKNRQREKDDMAEVINVAAKVISRRIIIRPSKDLMLLGVATDSLEGKILFETEVGEFLEFRVIGKQYREILDGDEGLLTYQGSRFISFESN